MKKAVPVLLVVFFLLSVAAVLFVKMKTNTSVSAESIVHAKDKETLKEYFPVPEFALVNQRGQTQTLSSFRNTVWVANFIFTQCKTICPLMTAKMVQLQKKLPTSDIQFVSFSVDPEHDTPEVLNTYANKWAPEEKRWTLFSTDEKQLNQLTQGLRITAQKTPGQIDPIMHSSVFLLIDKNGFVRGMFDSDDRKDFKCPCPKMESNCITRSRAPTVMKMLPWLQLLVHWLDRSANLKPGFWPPPMMRTYVNQFWCPKPRGSGGIHCRCPPMTH
jgi:cytochrome oxidase Cu insertion factor (SCO1/SenC/PrrC family)